MAEDKKVKEIAVVTAEKPVEVKAAEQPTPIKKATVKKTTAKKAGGEKTIKKARTTSAAKETKTVKKEKTTRVRKTAEPSLDNVTTVLWKKFKNANVSDIQTTIAVQIVIYDLGTFFIAIKEGGEKHIIQAVYNDRDGTLETSYDEIIKAAEGGYDYLNAINSGSMTYQGDLKKALILSKLFK